MRYDTRLTEQLSIVETRVNFRDSESREGRLSLSYCRCSLHPASVFFPASLTFASLLRTLVWRWNTHRLPVLAWCPVSGVHRRMTCQRISALANAHKTE